ncbi:MAG: NADH-quinone oxidoreductase subunit C [Candidatus Hydrothermarchaeales archaeon]
MNEVIDALKMRFKEDILHIYEQREKRIVAAVKKASILDVCRYLKEELDFDHLSTIAAVDRSRLVSGIDHDGSMMYRKDFEVTYHIWSYSRHTIVELKTIIPWNSPKLPSVTPIWRSANWHEREHYDLMGIVFEGHPNLRRILLPQNWKGHPLRKNYKLAESSWFLEKDEAESEGSELDEQVPYFELDDKLADKVKEAQVSEMIVRCGPVHPGIHGPWLINLKLDGEIIVDVDIQIGYIHRGLEKIAENRTYQQYLPVSDRYCWLTAISNNLSYVLAVEDLMDIKPTERAEYIRVIVLELNRLASHLIWLGAMGIDLGNISGLIYPFREREWMLDLLEMASGNRMNYNFGRFGGVLFDLDEKFIKKAKKTMEIFMPRLQEYADFFSGSRIWRARTQGVGELTAKDAKNLGVTGPMLRATGVKADTRKDDPYATYEEIDFEIPTRKDGDAFAMYEVRMEEMRISTEIIDQALDNLPNGPYQEEVGRVEPSGEALSRIEEPRGEIATYLVGDGSDKPYRLKVRAAEFVNISALPHLVRGFKIPDLIAIIGGMDPCLGGIDR